MNEYSKVGLYPHNIISYKKIKEAYDKGEKIVSIVHATGTGKTYNALQLAYDNKGKKMVYVAPSESIIEHIKNLINSNPSLDLKRDFPNLEFRTYQSFISMERDEIKNIECDLLILDEFHHIGAPVWGNRINTFLNTHPDIRVFGMTAYTIRDRGTPYERDMTNPDGSELFSNTTVSTYDLVDAIIDGVLPKPTYKSAYTNLEGLKEEVERQLELKKDKKTEYETYSKLLQDVKRRMNEGRNISDVLKANIKKDGKYIYFCPPISSDGRTDIDTIMKEAKEWLSTFVPENNIVFYRTTSKDGEAGKLNRRMFYEDKTLSGAPADNKLRIMFAINQYNEGVHAPNVDGVIMGRGTSSDIVFFEQLGRALSVREKTKEKYEEYKILPLDELMNLAKQRNIEIKSNSSKEEIIEKLLSPIIIDLTNNFDFIKELETKLKNRIKEYYIQKEPITQRKIELSDTSFDIEIANQDLFEMLKYLKDSLLPPSWERMYELAKKYYEHYGNLEISYNYKTINGYEFDDAGDSLGVWIYNQRACFKNGTLSKEKQRKLEDISMRFHNKDIYKKWNDMYKLVLKYYNLYGNIDIPKTFSTFNGIDYDEEGFKIGLWLRNQKSLYKNGLLDENKIYKLEKIGMDFDKNLLEERWQKMYKLAKIYYEHHGNLNVKVKFKTINGYEYDENGESLGYWINSQRLRFREGKLSEKRIDLLEQIKINFEFIDTEKNWEEMYSLALAYHKKYGNLDVQENFITSNGIDLDKNGKNLYNWLKFQREYITKGRLSKEREEKLLKLDPSLMKHKKDKKWEKMYELAKSYYEHHGNLNIKNIFITINGYEYDESGYKLGLWIKKQKTDLFNGKLSYEKIKKLTEIGMKFEKENKEKKWQKMYELAKKYFEHYGHLIVSQRFKTINGFDYDENGTNLGLWISTQRRNKQNNKLSKGREELLTKISMIFDIKKDREQIENICDSYNIDRERNKEILSTISYRELSAKINFLNQNNLELTTNKKLHEIFSMSSKALEEKYGLSLQDLITSYYQPLSKGE